MTPITPLRRVAFVGTYPPRRCGIATFTYDLRQAVVNTHPWLACPVIAMTDQPGEYAYPSEVAFELREQHFDDYRKAAEFLRFTEVEALCVQHEYGIFGGEAGAHLLTLLRDAGLPVVTTLHTILEKPGDSQRTVLRELIRLSHRVVSMSQRGARMLRDVYDAPAGKVTVVPHGIPDVKFTSPADYKPRFQLEGRKVLLTFGLLSPGKGLEHVIDALPAIIARHPDVLYLIVGTTHPNLVREHGDVYRFQLQERIRRLGIEPYVQFHDRFVSMDELTDFIAASDVYVTPYLNEAQITSGTLSYAYGCGKPVVSTPYWHAQELLAEDRGVLVPFADPGSIGVAVNGLLSDDAYRDDMRRRAYEQGRETVWGRVGKRYGELLRLAKAETTQAGEKALPTPVIVAGKVPKPPAEKAGPLGKVTLPPIKLDHVRRMSDSTGIFQHATYSFPNFDHGYCVDDNARALMLVCMLDDLHAGVDASTQQLTPVYAAFVQHAFNPDNGRFRNFMSFDRRWLEDAGSEDSQGRTLWALGTCIRRSRDPGLRRWAAQLFDRALPTLHNCTSPRAWAFALLGIHKYLAKVPEALDAGEARRALADRLMALYDAQARPDWPWFETILTYANAKLPHALIVSGQDLGEDAMVERGLTTLRWLCAQQTDTGGNFSPIGSEGFFEMGGTRAEFDQQPIEANATISACLAAYRLTHDDAWLGEAMRAFRWFLGANRLHQPLYHAANGGCRDGLHEDRLNQNQGAESTLAFLLSLVELKAHEQTLTAFQRSTRTKDDPPVAAVSDR